MPTGEIGGRYSDQDKDWQDWALPYMKKRGFGVFYFALNPVRACFGGCVAVSYERMVA
jgi:hypothetical protein